MSGREAVGVEVRGAVTAIERAPGVPVLAGLDLSVRPGSCHGIVGGSGSGKTTLLRVLLGRVTIRAGSVTIGRHAVPPPPPARLEFARTVGLVPQDAVGSLDPVGPIWWSVTEGLRIQAGVSRAEARAAATALLPRVGLDPALADRRPGELSGGQAQRACLARAIATGPGLILADEPTSALDPVLEASVLDLLARVRAETGATLLIVAHSLAVVRTWCDDVTVLHLGRAVERGPATRVLSAPIHEHTRALVEASADLNPGGGPPANP